MTLILFWILAITMIFHIKISRLLIYLAIQGSYIKENEKGKYFERKQMANYADKLEVTQDCEIGKLLYMKFMSEKLCMIKMLRLSL